MQLASVQVIAAFWPAPSWHFCGTRPLFHQLAHQVYNALPILNLHSFQVLCSRSVCCHTICHQIHRRCTAAARHPHRICPLQSSCRWCMCARLALLGRLLKVTSFQWPADMPTSLSISGKRSTYLSQVYAVGVVRHTS